VQLAVVMREFITIHAQRYPQNLWTSFAFATLAGGRYVTCQSVNITCRHATPVAVRLVAFIAQSSRADYAFPKLLLD